MRSIPSTTVKRRAEPESFGLPTRPEDCHGAHLGAAPSFCRRYYSAGRGSEGGMHTRLHSGAFEGSLELGGKT